MRNLFILTAIILLLSGCGVKRHDYIWHEYFISANRVQSRITNESGKPLKVIGETADRSEKFLGEVGPNKYFGNDQALTDGLAEQLTSELQKRGVKITDTADKTIEVRVDRTEFERGMWKLAATLEFTVKLGGEKVLQYTVRNSSPTTVDNTYDGAIALAVIKILNDPSVAAYING